MFIKKILLSFFTIVAFAFTANAQTPTYTAKGNVGIFTSLSEQYTTPFPEVCAAKVEVYGTDSIVVRNWCGAEDYDLVVKLNSEGAMSSAYTICEGTAMPYQYGENYFYCYSGLEAPIGMYADITESQILNDNDTKSGYICFQGWVYANNDDWDGSWNYYYLGWGDDAPTVSVARKPNYTAKGKVGVVESFTSEYVTPYPEVDSVSVEIYEGDSIIARDWCGAEEYDLVVDLNSDGTISNIYTTIDGTAYPYQYGDDYFYCYSRLEAPIGMYALASYSEVFNDTNSKSGYICFQGWVYANNDDYDGSWNYYYLGWGDDAPLTGINSATTTFKNNSETPTYNISGRIVNSNYKGIIIKDGKKYIRK